MKLKNILICALVAFGLAGCADEGPEVVANIEMSATATTLTATTASIRLYIPENQSNSLYSQYDISEAYLKPVNAENDNMYIRSINFGPSGISSEYVIINFASLQPATKYQLYVELYRGNNYDGSDLPLNGAAVQVAGFEITTAADGNYSNLGDAELTVDYCMFNEAKLTIALPPSVSTKASECEVQISTNPNFSTYDVIDYSSLEFNTDSYTNYTEITVSLDNLTEGTHYYLRIVGSFYYTYREDYGYNTSILIEGLNVMKCGDAGFTVPTLQDFTKIGTATLTVGYSYSDYVSLDLQLPIDLEYWDWDHRGTIVYSTDPTFKTITGTVEWVSYYSPCMENLKPGTTYYTRIYGKFVFDANEGPVVKTGYLDTDPKSFTTLE